MIIPYQYAYLFAASLVLIPWGIIFLLRKDLHKEMLSISLLMGFAGMIMDGAWYTQDWIKPTTITGTQVGIEDFILAFGAGGIASVIYKELFHKTTYKLISLRISHWKLALPLVVTIATAHILFAYAGWFSFWANVAGISIGLILMSLIRKDLEREAFLGGVLLTLFTIPGYWLLFFLSPVFRQEYWNYKNTSGILFLGIPYEDLVWWFFIGALMAIMYDYWNLLRLRSLRK